MFDKEYVHERIVRAIAEIDRYLCSKKDLSQYDIDDIFERFKAQFPQIKCKNCVSYYKDPKTGTDFCFFTDRHLILDDEGLCDNFISK